MKKYIRLLAVFSFACVAVLCLSFSTSAKSPNAKTTSSRSKLNDQAIVFVDKSVGLKLCSALLDGAVQPQYTLSELLADHEITNIYFLSPERIDELSENIAKQSKVYLVELRDGRKTYYMAVDFQNDESVCLSNIFVLRATSRKLLERSQSLQKSTKTDYVALMDYTHIVGELGLHYAGYRVTNAMGGEILRGPIGKAYNSFKVADLNIDEQRMPLLIRIVGQVIG